MSQNLKLRVLTALVGAPVILLLLTSMGIEGVAFLAWVVSMGMLYEYCRMCFKLEDARQKTFLALATNTFIHAFNYVIPTGLGLSFITVVPSFMFFIVFLFMVPRLFHYKGKEFLDTDQGVAILRSHVQELMALCFGLIYCVVFPILMVGIREFSGGQHWLILTLIIIWASDSFAYFVGLKFGKRRLYETISPKKSWEGAFGGALGAVLLSVLYARFFLPRESISFLVPVAVVLSAVGIIGDLAESLLKRAFQMKDSGSILPGHGGFLDRFDGVVFALPVMYGILRFFA
jgi:phosphatidate cytidylyltransferase